MTACKNAMMIAKQNNKAGIMRCNLKYNVLDNPLFRAVCFVVSIIFLAMGALTLASKLGESSLKFDHNFKFGIAATGWGVILFFLSIRNFFRRRKK